MIGLFFLICFSALASEPLHWSHILEIGDKHEFYKNNETLSHPKNAWQTLFSLSFVDKKIRRFKDCVYYRTPGLELGVLKITTMSASTSCEEKLLTSGDLEIKNIKSLQYAVTDEGMKLIYSLSDYSTKVWTASLQRLSQEAIPQSGLSSAEARGSKFIFLAPEVRAVSSSGNKLLKNGDLCHNINDECDEIAPSSCNHCPEGWYEIPTGCIEGPKYCGRINCGGKNAPACRRGMRWQRNESDFDCRTDSTFAYCAGHLKVTCEGRKAFCR